MKSEVPRSGLPTPGDSTALLAEDPRIELAYDRTHLANERTLAAWLRTGLSVAAGGIAIARLVPEPARDSILALGLGAAFVIFGIGIIAYGARQFERTTNRLAAKSPWRVGVRPRSAYVLTGVLALLLLVVLWFLWTHRGTPV